MVAQSSPNGKGAAHRLLTGYGALAARNLPFTALQFPLFEAIRRRLWERRDGQSSAVKKDGSGGVGGGERRIEAGSGNMARGLLETGIVNAMSAAVSGAIAAVATTPTDVVKTRMMLSAGEGEQGTRHDRAAAVDAKETGNKTNTQGETTGKQGGSSSQPQKRMSGWQVARLVYQERGLKGLFRGGLLRASWTAVGSGLYLGTYEVAKVWLKGTDDGEDDDL